MLAPVSDAGEDRFYIMALEDINSSTKYTWYDAAYGQLSDYATITSTDFGSGKTNTSTMITKWYASEYGTQNDHSSYYDVWGVIQTEVSEGWFLPSSAEWSAFVEELGIADSNYSSYNLNYYYWSSSLGNTGYAWIATFYYGCVGNNTVDSLLYVRLSATF